MIEIARTLKPDVETVVRTHSDEEAALLRKEQAGMVFIGEHELALGITRHVLERVATAQPGEASEAVVLAAAHND